MPGAEISFYSIVLHALSDTLPYSMALTATRKKINNNNNNKNKKKTERKDKKFGNFYVLVHHKHKAEILLFIVCSTCFHRIFSKSLIL